MTRDADLRAERARLLVKHRAGLHGYILACVHNHEEARQIMRQVALTIAEGSGRLPAEQEFLPWARAIARARILACTNVGLNGRPVDPVLVQRLTEAAARVETMRPAWDYKTALLSCLEELPVRSRLLLALRHDNSIRDMDELALRLGRSVEVTAALLKEIKVQLRNCVERRSTAKFDHGITRSE